MLNRSKMCGCFFIFVICIQVACEYSPKLNSQQQWERRTKDLFFDRYPKLFDTVYTRFDFNYLYRGAVVEVIKSVESVSSNLCIAIVEWYFYSGSEGLLGSWSQYTEIPGKSLKFSFREPNRSCAKVPLDSFIFTNMSASRIQKLYPFKSKFDDAYLEQNACLGLHCSIEKIDWLKTSNVYVMEVKYGQYKRLVLRLSENGELLKVSEVVWE